MADLDEVTKLSEKELMEVLTFANAIYNSNPFGYFTPNTSNSILKDLNNNPLAPTIERVNQALADYKNNEQVLQSYSEFMSVYDIIYRRFIEYYANLLSFQLDISCTNAYSPNTDYKSKEYKEDLRRVYKFLDNFDYEAEFRNVVKELLRHEVDYTWLRTSQGTINDDANEKIEKLPKYTLQTLPQNKCLITGKWERGMLFDFDMSYFTKSGVDINSYDPIFKTYYRNVFDGNESKYVPTTSLNNRFGDFALWTQTSPNDGAWMFKFDMSNTAIVPFLAPMISQCLTNGELEKLQMDKNMITARALLVGEIQTMDKQKSGNGTDAMTYNLKTLLKLMSLVKKGLDSNINAVAMPTASPKLYQYNDTNKEMVLDGLKNSIGKGASASSMIFNDEKASESEAKNAIITDYNIVKKLYSQFNHFLDFYVNKKTRKYKFAFKFSGCSYDFVNEKENQRLIDLADKGVILAPRTYSKLVGMKPQEFERLLEEGKYSEWTESLLGQLISIHTQSGKEDDKGSNPNGKGGRPILSDSEISDSGARAREYNSQI